MHGHPYISVSQSQKTSGSAITVITHLSLSWNVLITRGDVGKRTRATVVVAIATILPTVTRRAMLMGHVYSVDSCPSSYDEFCDQNRGFFLKEARSLRTYHIAPSTFQLGLL